MVMLVTLQEASDHLRRDTDDDDNDLELKIIAASNAIQNYLKDPMICYEWAMDEWGKPLLDSSGEKYLAIDSSGDYIIRREVKIAVLMLIGDLYKDREGGNFGENINQTERLGHMVLPKSIHFLLDPLRKPTIA